MNSFKKLPVFFVDINTLSILFKKNKKIDFENLGIITDQKIALCKFLYTKYKIINKPYSIYVDNSTYQSFNKKIIIFIAEYLVIQHSLGKKPSTLTAYIKSLTYFFKWIADNNLTLNSSIANTRYVFQNFTYHLKKKIRLAKLSSSTAQYLHSHIYKLLHGFYKDNENYILSGNNLIMHKKINSKKTLKSKLSDQKYHYVFYFKLFNQITDFLLNEESYPLKLSLVQKQLWCLPSQKTFNDENTVFPQVFNPIDGSIRTTKEIKELYNLQMMSEATYRRNSFLERLEKSNKFRSEKRLELAAHGLKAFFILFLTNTGMNDSTAATLKWNDDFKLEKENYKFTSIKYRAGNKIVEFEVRSKFIKYFKKFLELRKYLLNDNIQNFLFFNYRYGKINNQNILKGSFSSYINNYFKHHIDQNLPILNSKTLRVNKIMNTIKNDGIIAASQVAQSSINTIISSYMGESSESSEKQFSEYFTKLNKNLLIEDKKNYFKTSIGKCKKKNSPNITIKHEVFNNCDRSEGCLFCSNFCIHADKEDIYKLFSLKYVINECRYVAKNIEHFNNIYSVVFERIENIVTQIKNSNILSKEEINTYEHDVFINENLHPFWEFKLKTLCELGVLK